MQKTFCFLPTYSMNQNIVRGIRTCLRIALLGTFLGFSPTLRAQALLPSTPPESSVTAPHPAPAEPSHPAESSLDTLREAYQKLAKGQLDPALDMVNGVIHLDSQNKGAYLLRGLIYAQKQQWDKAENDYEFILAIDPQNTIVKFDQAELKFMQKKYDDARAGFTQVESDKELGDFATYKVLVCDLFGAHEAAAAKDIEAINEVGGNPSYYFGNAAWDLVHNKPQDAANWLKSAANIYAGSPQTYAKYTSCLKSMGYLPLHLSTAQ